MRALIPVCLAFFYPLVVATPVTAQEFVSAGQMGGPEQEYGCDGANSVVVGSEGNVYVGGSFGQTGDFDPGPATYPLSSVGECDAFIAKLDHQGHLLWAGGMGSLRSDLVNDMVLDPAGNLLVVGDFDGDAFDADPGPGTVMLIASRPGTEAFLSKLDSAGHLIWARQAAAHAVDTLSYSRGLLVAVDGSGNIYVSGVFRGTVDCDPGPGTFNLSTPSDARYVSKLDSLGNLIWARQLGDSVSFRYTDLLVDAGGNAYMTGSFSGTADFDPGPGTFQMTATQVDGFIAKLGPAGNLVWAQQLGGSGFDSVEGGTLDADGNFYVTGGFQGAVDFDPGPGSFFMSTPGETDHDAFVGKFSDAHTLLWARQLGGFGTQGGNTLTRDTVGRIYTTGTFYQSGDFDPGPGFFILMPTGAYSSTYLSILDGGGNFVSAAELGSRAATTAALAGYLYLVGNFSGTVDFDPGPGTYPLTAVGRTDAFISRLGGPCPAFIDNSPYGQLVLPPACTREAFPLTTDLYATTQLLWERGARDRLFLSSTGGTVTGQVLSPVFTPLVVEDRIRINGVDLELEPYSYQPGVPPVLLYTPIESNLAPVPGPELGTNVIPTGSSTIQVELLDTDRAIYGHTALYLVRDCGILPAGNSPTKLNWISHDAETAGTDPEFDVRYGLLSHLEQDQDFSRVSCLGRFFSTPAMDAGPNPPVGDGYYYLARGLDSCVTQGYGTSSLVPDPRAALDALPACP